MSLWSFIEERCKAKGIKPFDLVDEGISSATLYRMQDGGTPGERIKNKLSVGLGCSIGEINEAISQTDQTTPFGETVKKTKKKESVMETVEQLEQMVDPDPEEEIHLYNVKRPTEPEPPAKVPIKRTDGSKEYKKHLTDILMNILLQLHPGEGSLTEVYASFGYAVAKELGDDGNV